MMTSWSQFNPARIIAGPGVIARLPGLVPAKDPVLLVTTSGFTRRGTTEQLLDLLGRDRVVVYDRVTPNAKIDDLERAAVELRGESIGSIVGVGGGSTLDTAKVLSAILPGTATNPLKDIFRSGAAHSCGDSLRLVAVPTTSGTGSEVTPFATVWDQTTHKKHSLAGEHLFPSDVVLDPELTLSLPPEETLYSALDAISHALESLWNKNRTPVSIAYAMQAVVLASEALPIVLERPSSLDGRAAMQYASLLAGMAVSQTRTAIAHSISYPLTSRFGVPHGLACSFTLAEILQMNLDNLSAQVGHKSSLVTILHLLQRLELGGKVKKYVSVEELASLQTEMLTTERFENFDGNLDGLGGVIERSLR